jgi:hypothetical protein
MVQLLEDNLFVLKREGFILLCKEIFACPIVELYILLKIKVNKRYLVNKRKQI